MVWTLCIVPVPGDLGGNGSRVMERVRRGKPLSQAMRLNQVYGEYGVVEPTNTTLRP